MIGDEGRYLNDGGRVFLYLPLYSIIGDKKMKEERVGVVLVVSMNACHLLLG